MDKIYVQSANAYKIFKMSSVVQSNSLGSLKLKTNPNSQILAIRDPCGGALRSSCVASTPRTGSIPWVIGWHCPLLLYLHSLGHVFDIQRKFRVTNECCKHKWILFLCRFFGNCVKHLERVTGCQKHGWRMEAVHSNHMPPKLQT